MLKAWVIHVVQNHYILAVIAIPPFILVINKRVGMLHACFVRLAGARRTDVPLPSHSSVADTYFWLVVVWKLIGLRPFNSLTAIGGHDRQLFLSFFGEEILNKFLSNFSV